MKENETASPQKDIFELHEATRSLIMSTKNAKGALETSYAPYVFYNECYYVLVSGLAPHGRNFETNPDIGILLIEDEEKTKNIFARARLSYSVTAVKVERQTDEFSEVTAKLKERTGKTVDVLVGLEDFNLFRLEPHEGRFIIGFGKAYLLNAKTKEIVHVDKDVLNSQK